MTRSSSDVRSPVKHVPQLSLTGLRSSLQASNTGRRHSYVLLVTLIYLT